MTAEVAIDVDTFFRRLQRLRTLWKQSNTGDIMAKCEALMVTLGNPSDATVSKEYCAIYLATWL